MKSNKEIIAGRCALDPIFQEKYKKYQEKRGETIDLNPGIHEEAKHLLRMKAFWIGIQNLPDDMKEEAYREMDK